MWAAFKAFSVGTKLAIIGGILATLLAILAGAYEVGYTKGHDESKIAVAQYETKVHDLQTKLNTATGKVDIKYVTQYVDRDKIIDHTVTVNHDVIHTVVPEQFKFSNGWVYAYNQSVQGLEIDPILAKDDTASAITDRTGLGVINDNNGIALANANQLDNLIADVKEREAAANAVTNSK